MDLATIFSTPQEKGKSYGDYLQVLEKEKKKIQVFQRELPLSLHLVTYAIESCRRQIGSELFPPRVEVRSEHVEEELVSVGAPAFEEFIPLKVNSTTQDADEEQSGDTAGKKSDWLKTVKLWTPLPNEEHNKLSAPTVLSFLPQTRPHQDMAAQSEVSTPPPQTASSTSETRGVIGSSSSGGEEKRSQTHRKSRRCWSQDLHRRFLDALNQLGGTEVATPKRIREIMKEDGLTNDEVKSHLQKYRLHSRRPGQSSQSKASNTQQVVVLGGVWMPAAEYNSAFAATAPAAWNHSSGHRPSGH